MTDDILNLVDSAHASLTRAGGSEETLTLKGTYHCQLVRDGEIIWEDTIENLVVDVGKIDLLDKYLSGSAYTAAFFIGLVDSGGSYAAANTMASHAGWTENTGYSNANRPTPSFGGASGSGTVSKATTATAFNINATSTIGGAFLTTNNTKGGTTGTLFSAGNFTGGNRSVVSGDTLNVTYTLSC